jgi:hypothetical protein
VRVLITNNTLAHRAGSELWVRDVAIRLLERGHSPVAYSRELGEVAAELRRATVAVVDDLDRMGTPPDLIHGHHHLETMTAALRFPAAPVVAVCHGWLPPQEAPVRFPSIRRYLAVDAPTRDRLVLECGIEPSRVEVLPNFVDLRRFPPRGPLPERPRRALVLSNLADEDGYLAVIRDVCRQAGIEVDAHGLRLGRPLAAPEALIGEYDLVFAKARTALEAAAVGTAVIVCDEVGLGPMVDSRGLRRLRELNFGIRAMRREITAENLGRELARYDPAEAAEVSRRLRAEADLESTVDRLLALYAEVVEEQARLGEPDAGEIGRAASAYLRHGPLRGGDLGQDGVALALARDEAARLRAELSSERAAARRLGDEHARAAADRDEARAAEARAAAAAASLRDELEAARRALHRAEEEHAAAQAAAAADLAWITGTLTWRLRSRVLGPRWIVRLYRRLRGLDDQDRGGGAG